MALVELAEQEQMVLEATRVYADALATKLRDIRNRSPILGLFPNMREMVYLS